MEQTQALRPAFTPRDHPLKNKYEGPGLDMGHVKARPLISKKMAEREGFEPSKELSSFTRLAGERLQPTRPSLRKKTNPVKTADLRGAIKNPQRTSVAHGGGSRIRTHGPLRDNGFQDRLLKPLGHPSLNSTEGYLTQFRLPSQRDLSPFSWMPINQAKFLLDCKDPFHPFPHQTNRLPVVLTVEDSRPGHKYIRACR